MVAVTITSLTPAALAIALAAGAVSFVSPCVLPLVPVYLSYVSGVAVEDLDRRRRHVVLLSLAFIAGFTVVFVALGAAMGGVGALLHDHRDVLTYAGGVFLIVAGLVMADVVHLPGAQRAISPRGGGLGGAFLTGAVVCIGWTPCVGYVLGSILTLAGGGGSVAAGALLLLVYSLGLGLPFLAAALAFDWVMDRLGVLKRHYRVVQIGSGVVLVAFGLVLLIGGPTLISRHLPSFSPFGL